MSVPLSPGAQHTVSINWRYGTRPFLKNGESLASCTALVNGVAAPAEVDGDETLWDVVVPTLAVQGSKVVSEVSIVTDSVPPRKDTRRVVHYVGIADAKPI